MVCLRSMPVGVERDTMTLAELASRLDISLTTAYELAARDALPIPKIPGLSRYRYSRKLYDRLIETGTITELPNEAA